MSSELLTHLDADGRARMVDVGAKPETDRVATARAVVRMTPQTAAAVAAGDAPKGDVIGTARLAAIQTVPLRRLGTKDDIANLVLFLCSDAGSFCNGGVFVCDGGQGLMGARVFG